MEIIEGLVKKHLVAESFPVDIGYDRESEDTGTFTGEIQIDFYGRVVPKHSHRTANFMKFTSSSSLIINSVLGSL